MSGLLRNLLILHLEDDGSMNPAARQGSLDAIANDHRVKVILISTKSGNSGTPFCVSKPPSFIDFRAGLNLTCCSNVIMTDPWWNPAIGEYFARFEFIDSF